MLISGHGPMPLSGLARQAHVLGKAGAKVESLIASEVVENNRSQARQSAVQFNAHCNSMHRFCKIVLSG
jgi:hypothetical protein